MVVEEVGSLRLWKAEAFHSWNIYRARKALEQEGLLVLEFYF